MLPKYLKKPTMRYFFHPVKILSNIRRTCFTLRQNQIQFLICGIVLVLFCVEILVYYCITYSWYSMGCEKNEDCTRILLVADPQLIGLHNEPIKFLTPISIWDSDRYLAKTFSSAFYFTRPDVIIFLGDLFDEGSTATNDEFKVYCNRLYRIFGNESHNSPRYIYLPGDNDIGGEGIDRVTRNKVDRFQHIFQQPDIIRFKNVNFFKLNELTFSAAKNINLHNGNNLDSIVVGLSHMSVLSSHTSLVEKILQALNPQLFFSAHTHTLMITKADNDEVVELIKSNRREYENRVYEYTLGIKNEVYEISVPTCSYRMGTNHIGYGFAVIDNKKNIRYTVLWSPSRYLQLKCYGFTVLFIFIYAVYRGSGSCCIAVLSKIIM